MASFCDLNLVSGAEKNDRTREVIFTAVKFGYVALCINNVVEELPVKTGKRVKEKVASIKKPDDVLLPRQLFETVTDQHCALRSGSLTQFSRFTAVLTDSSQSIRLKEPAVQAYDVVAVQPVNQKVFLDACKTYNIDVISLDLSQRMDSMLFGKSARAAVGCAISRGVHFEIIYAPMIRDSAARRSTITYANLLVELCRGKNIVISSGTNRAIEIRGPYDVSHLGLMFGLTAEQARHAVTTNCRAAILHGVARKCGNGVVQCCKADSLPQSDRWKLLNSPTEQQLTETDNSKPEKKYRKLS